LGDGAVLSSSERIPGTGPGLQIRSEFAAVYGSKVHVESDPEVGSTFSFSVPKAQ